MFLKNIATISCILFLVSGCGSVNKKNPYRPSGKTQETVEKEKMIVNKKLRYEFLRDRYKLCSHRRALRSAIFEYKKLDSREKRYGNNLSAEKEKYKKVITEIKKRTTLAERKFQNTYKRRLYCRPKEMRHLNL